MKTREQALQDLADFMAEIGARVDHLTDDEVRERLAGDRWRYSLDDPPRTQARSTDVKRASRPPQSADSPQESRDSPR